MFSVTAWLRSQKTYGGISDKNLFLSLQPAKDAIPTIYKVTPFEFLNQTCIKELQTSEDLHLHFFVLNFGN